MQYNNELVLIIKDDDVATLKKRVKNMRDVSSANYSVRIHTDVNNNSEDNNTSGGQNDLISENGLTLLHVAAFYDSLDCFRYLQKSRQVPLNTLSAHAFLPLHYACWAGSSEVALYILTEDPSQVKFQVQGAHDLQLLYCSLMGRDTEIIETLFEKGLKLEDSYNNQEKIIEKAIGLHKPPILRIIYDHYKPKKGTIDCAPIVKTVLDHNPEAFSVIYNGPSDIKETTPEKPHDNLISLICDNDRDKKFKNILLSKLIKDAKDLDLEPVNPSIPGICHWACYYMDVDVARQLLKLPCCKIDRIVAGKTGPSRLINKKEKGIPDMLNCLIDCGFDINNTFGDQTPSLLESFAIYSIQKNLPAIQVLLDRGGDIDAPSLKSSKRKSIYEYVLEMKGASDDLIKMFKAVKEQKNGKK